MKILLLDIETAPNLVHVWGLWQQNVGIPQIITSGYILCWAAKWYGESDIQFDSIHASGKKTMLRRIHRLIEAADVIVHYNGKKFDIPTLNKEFLLVGLSPPAPYKQLDLLSVCRTQFKFPSNKLQYVAKALGLSGKAKTVGHDLWIQCMANDPDAWKAMKDYNIQDIRVLEAVYNKVLPWIKNHPNYGLYRDAGLVCTNCGSKNYQHRGYAHTKAQTYRRFQCNEAGCRSWFRSKDSEKKKHESFRSI